MADKQQVQLEEFRESIKEVTAVLTRLSSLTDSVPDLLGMVSLATENDAQLGLLMKLILADKK